MADTITTAGLITSFGNTPQANPDEYYYTEDSSSYIWLDVMSNDLGGKAKTLYSISSETDISSLLEKDIVGTEELSALGATISIGFDITDNKYKIKYEPGSAFDYLAAGETATDTFRYAIRLANGALSWDTVTITITGTNDAPVITSAAQSGSATEWVDLSVAELADTPHTANGAVTYSDVDTLDTHTASVAPQALGYVGTFTLDPVDDTADSVGWHFSVADSAIDYLQASQILTQKYDVTVDDGHGGTATQTVTITITGTNDAPVISIESGDGASAELTDGASALFATDTLTATDVDVSDLMKASIQSVSHSGAGVNGMTDAQLLALFSISPASPLAIDSTSTTSGPITWAFNADASKFDYLTASDTLTLTYTVQVDDGHGGVDTQDVTITIHGVNESDPNDFDDATATPTGTTPTSGNDILLGTSGNDGSINLGNGNDTYYAGAGNDGTIIGSNGDDKVYGQAGNDTINGNNDSDIIYGGSGDDIINGINQNDTLYGGSGADTIDGGGGSDVIIGGYGSDALTGGGDSDTFKYLSTLDGGDVITDFVHSDDKIDLSAIDAISGTAGDEAFTFVAAQNTGVVANSVTWYQSGGDTFVQADVNGDTVADFAVTLTGIVNLMATDFTL